MRLLSIVTSETEDAGVGKNGITLKIDKARGTIYDCNLKRITNSSYRYVAAVSPTPEAIAAVGMLKNSQDVLKRLMAGKPVLIDSAPELNGDGINVFRVYNHFSANQLASHLVGYLDDTGNGVSGIEKGYNNALASDGYLSIHYSCDAKGRVLTGINPDISNSQYDPTKGVVLTIDSEIQKELERIMKKYIKTGAAVLIDVQTGKIKASVSVPDFSPSSLATSLKDPDSPLINRAFTAFNTGSVFKCCVAAAALEAGISPSYTCTGKINIGEVQFGCRHNHGTMNLESALAVSCNTYFINLGQQLGADRIYSMAKNLGFGNSLQLSDSIRSASGNLPDYKTIKALPAALGNFSFGQGDLMTTPLQIASMCQTIANGGKKITPSLIEGEMSANGVLVNKAPQNPYTRVISEKNADILKQYMINVVEHGTGTTAKPAKGGAGGKTATAETGWVIGGRSILQAWFAGFFPADQPKYALA
ncbi:MAG: hypothetical protein BGN88_14335, partial [Clostridiales bacterium 43-6]